MNIELHIIQNFVPSNLNRDDTNNPKDCEFGGVRRARISSQCIKRAIRNEPVFSATTQVAVGERTRWLASEIKKILIEKGKDEKESHEKAVFFVDNLLGGMDSSKPERSKVLFYISHEEKNHIAENLMANWDTLEDVCAQLVKDYKKVFENRNSAPDIALFGRMLADDPKLNLDAACQVAHAISTHRVNMDVDFFTAVDDLLIEEESGAGMMGITGFNSACFYRYALINWQQLLKNLDNNSDLATKTVLGFIRAAVLAVPTGKQNSFAAQNPPSFVLAVVREDGMCWSLANAFEKPVSADHTHSLVENSIAVLDKYWGDLKRIYSSEPEPVVLSLDGGETIEFLKDSVVQNLEKFLNAVQRKLKQE